MRLLQNLVLRAAAQTPDAVALRWDGGAMTYRELDRLADQVASWLQRANVSPGDRVAVWLPKSAEAVAAMQGILRVGAAYVPIDPLSPKLRAQAMLEDCGVRAAITTAAWAGAVAGAPCLTLDPGESSKLPELTGEPLPAPPRTLEDLAYILYTSGSTGRPKGVCLSHGNALAFVDWAVATFEATPADRFANHAPLHFDLSVLDLYAAFAVGASTYLVAEGENYAPRALSELLERAGITVWYSVPSALVLMMEHGGLLERDAPSLRAVLFAGEAFPPRHLGELRARWPEKRFWNLFGPTETNVCTAHEVTTLEADQLAIPIGTAACEDEVWAVTEDGRVAGPGEEGELMVSGPTVMLGYHGHPPRAAGPYATGDRVRLDGDGRFWHLGRRDHMVKLRGFRIELGEIERALLAHPAVREAAVLVRGDGADAKLVAYLAPSSKAQPSLLAIKQHCAERLPRSMIVDRVRWLSELPRTRNGKVDRLALAAAHP